MQHHRKRSLALMIAVGIASTAFLGGVSSAEAGTCAAASHPGGDWPSLNGNASNTRNQTLETTIGTAEVATLAPSWTFSPASLGSTGQIQSTPVVAEGCVYITTSSAFVYALNADTGDQVWAKKYDETVAGVCCGGTLFAPAIADGVLYLNVSHNPTTSSDEFGPYVLAVDAHTGDVLWKSNPVADEEGTYTNSSAIFVENGENDLVIIGISNPEMDLNQAGGFALIDASAECTPGTVLICNNPGAGNGGEMLVRTRTIPDEQYEEGMGGGSIWSTAAVDDDLYAYAGTGQPAGWFDAESEFVNAIIKFDVDATRETFGQIVDVHKGTWDSEVRSDSLIPYVDVDFAASPTLYQDQYGRPMIAELQKSGWVHAAFTKHMTEAWSTPVSAYGTFLGNYASTATDGSNIFVHGSYPGNVMSLDGETGIPNWVAAAPTVAGANPVTYANGVVWLPDGLGFLNAWDAATGLPLLRRSMAADVGAQCMNTGGGVSIARNTVYAVCGDGSLGYSNGPNDNPTGYIIAYTLGA